MSTLSTSTPTTGDEKESLKAFLDKQRAIVLWKLEGLGDEDLRRAMVPSGTNLLGMVKHLAVVEYGWFCMSFDIETEPLPDRDAHLTVAADETTEGILAFYQRARAAADTVIAERDLDDVGTARSGDPVSLRWILLHLIEEIARHAGHMDIVREMIDGETGYLPSTQ